MRRGSSPGSVRGYAPRRLRRYAYRRHWHQYETLASSSSSSAAAAAPLSRTQTLGLGLFIGLCVYVLYQMLSVESLDGGSAIRLGRRCPSDEFVAMLTRHSTPDKFIVLALVDTAFADMAINLYESSLRPHGIDNFLFVGAGHRACEILRNASLPCHHYTEDRDTDVASIYQSPAFIRKMNIRTEMILDALSVGFTVLHTDLDVVFIHNPIADLKVVLLTVDLATMWDSVAHNAGFVVVRPTQFSRAIYERVKRITGFSRNTDDQTALNTAIHFMNRSHKRRRFNAVMLDRKKYLCGVDYFEKGNRVFPSKERCADCMVVHNNWIVSREAKIYRFKEHFMWMYDKDSYYSNASETYLTYGNPVTWPTLASNDAEELSALKAALALGQMLGRVVILPRFHCSKSAAGIGGDMGGPPRLARRRGDRRAPRVASTVPPTPTHECPLNCLLNVTAFDAQFGRVYRESSFLQHPLVPTVLRDDRSPPQVVYRGPQRSTKETGADDSLLPAAGVQLSVDNATRLFGLLPHQVLVFHSLYRVQPRFASVDEQRTFDNRVRKAFRRGTYRQM